MRARGCGRLRPVSTSRGSVTLLEGRIMCTDTVVHTWSALVVLVGLSGRLWAAMPAQLLARPRPDPAPAKHFGTRAQVMLLVFGRPWHFTESLGRLPGRIVAFLRHFCGSVSACASAFWKSGRLFGKAARQEGRFCCFRHRRAAPDHLVRHVVYRFSANETQENPSMTSLQLT